MQISRWLRWVSRNPRLRVVRQFFVLHPSICGRQGRLPGRIPPCVLPHWRVDLPPFRTDSAGCRVPLDGTDDCWDGTASVKRRTAAQKRLAENARKGGRVEQVQMGPEVVRGFR